MQEEESEIKKLPIEERCVHKSWKARCNGYEEAAKLFRTIDDEKCSEWMKYLGLIKKFVIDSNVVGQEKGLEATLVFIENCGYANRTVGEVMSGIITKCIAAPKAKTKDLAVQCTLMYIEIEKQDIVMEELLKGTEHKNPKIVAACVSTITLALQEFGSKVVAIKPLVKKIPTLLADRDKTVRDEGKAMVIEMFRWIGAALKPQLASLQPLQVTELEQEFDKLNGVAAKPTRYLRSQQQKQAKIAAEALANGNNDGNEDQDGDDDDEDQVDTQIDPYDLMDPIDILSKLPKDFFDKVEAKKWQERKEALEKLEELLKAPKLESGDYGDIVRALKKIIQKDATVMVVALAGKCLAQLANGLKKRFAPYASACIPALLEKFREKKTNVVTALRDAIDAVFISTNVENILEDVIESLNNKNPSVKTETAAFLSRAFCQCQPVQLTKKLLKAYCTALLKTLNEPDPGVRDASADALGTLMKLVTEKQIMPFLVDVESIKMSKIKECCDKAVILVKTKAPPKKERPSTAPQTKGKQPAATPTVKRPATATKKVAAGAAKKVVKVATSKPVSEKELSQDEVDERASECLSSDVLSGLGDVNWKSRLQAIQRFNEIVAGMEPADVSTQVLVKTVTKKPGLKDTNFQVLRMRLEAIKMLAENYTFSMVTANSCLPDIVDKLSDVKNGVLAAQLLSSIAEATNFEAVSSEVLNLAFEQKSPKIKQETLLWLSTAITEFGLSVNIKLLVDCLKKALSTTSPDVRTAAITLIGILYLYKGNDIMMLFSDEKASIKQQIEAEFVNRKNEKMPVPTRGKQKKVTTASQNSLDNDEDAAGAQSDPEESDNNIRDIIAKTDISAQMNEALMNELSDKNWKVRMEALQKIQNILNENKSINSNIGDLPQYLAPRLIDSNSKIAQTTLQLCEALAKAMGSPCKSYIRNLFPGFLQGLGDSKSWIRTAAISCINAWGDEAGYKEFFDNEMIADALKIGSPTLRIELWAWIAEKLPIIKPKSIPKEELTCCVPYLYTNLEDRNVDVRKNAQEAVLAFMLHLGYEAMLKLSDKLKPGSKTVVIAALDKARPSLPVKPLPSKPIKEASGGKSVKSGGAMKAAAGTIGKSGSKTKIGGSSSSRPSTSSKSKKDEDVDLSPLLAINNLKLQRSLDEQLLKCLKWNFTQPREEFVDLLKDQMASANVNKSLMANMFHSDFRYHLKAIESLTEDLDMNFDALVANLDLVLKWLTLRFFDTNPSVLLKGLEYLQIVFGLLVENEHCLTDCEASSFIPYLILKVGDPKDAVRNGVRALFKQITCIYSVPKLFNYLIDGLKSKNARQRTECLDELSFNIEQFGSVVIHPQSTTQLREIAKQISDRDNSVRNAALNCIVQAYKLQGEKIYRQIGQISDKDMSLLEERIKRASKAIEQQQQQLRGATTNTTKVTTVQSRQSTITKSKRDSVIVEQHVQQQQQQLDIEQDDEPQQIQNIPTLPLVSSRTDSVMPISPPKRITANDVMGLIGNSSNSYDMMMMGSGGNTSNVNNNYGGGSGGGGGGRQPGHVLMRTLDEIRNPNIKIAIPAIFVMSDMLRASEANMMTGFEDDIMSALLIQIKNISQMDVGNPETMKAYRHCFTFLIAFYENKVVGRNVSRGVLKEMLHELIQLLICNKITNLPDSEPYIKVINVICLRLIDRSDPTNIICALIELLNDCSTPGSASPRYIELVMKCLWKVVKILPQWSDELDYDSILLQQHIFFTNFPTIWWKQQPEDTPSRTIKTILHAMSKIKGHSILSHFTQIPNPHSTELYTYLVKILKSLKIEQQQQQSNVVCPMLKKDPAPNPLSRSMHNLLTEIFKKIGVKETSKEGLLLLYEFKEQHPQADIDPFLKRSSEFFQQYIKNGLEEIAEQKRKHERNQSKLRF